MGDIARGPRSTIFTTVCLVALAQSFWIWERERENNNAQRGDETGHALTKVQASFSSLRKDAPNLMLPGGFSTADQTDCTYRLFFKVIVWSLQGDGKLVSRIKLCHYKFFCGEVLVLGQRDCIVQWEDCIHLLGLLWKLQKWETKIKGCQIDYMNQTWFKDQIQKEWKLPNGHWKLLNLFWDIREGLGVEISFKIQQLG